MHVYIVAMYGTERYWSFIVIWLLSWELIEQCWFLIWYWRALKFRSAFQPSSVTPGNFFSRAFPAFAIFAFYFVALFRPVGLKSGVAIFDFWKFKMDHFWIWGIWTFLPQIWILWWKNMSRIDIYCFSGIFSLQQGGTWYLQQCLKGSFSCKRGFSLLNFERGLKKNYRLSNL